jgi:hypothetical protein
VEYIKNILTVELTQVLKVVPLAVPTNIRPGLGHNNWLFVFAYDKENFFLTGTRLAEWWTTWTPSAPPRTSLRSATPPCPRCTPVKRSLHRRCYCGNASDSCILFCLSFLFLFGQLRFPIRAWQLE